MHKERSDFRRVARRIEQRTKLHAAHVPAYTSNAGKPVAAGQPDRGKQQDADRCATAREADRVGQAAE